MHQKQENIHERHEHCQFFTFSLELNFFAVFFSELNLSPRSRRRRWIVYVSVSRVHFQLIFNLNTLTSSIRRASVSCIKSWQSMSFDLRSLALSSCKKRYASIINVVAGFEVQERVQEKI